MPDLFLNAYNFVPLPKDPCVRESLEKGKLTGKITCTIIPKTDIFVPNTSNETCNTSGKHGDKVREFFSYKQLEDNYEMTNDNAPEHPVIPGSEIRGMVRSMYETMTNSCLSALDMPDILSSRSSVPKKAGIVVYANGEFKLYNAKAYNLDYRTTKKHKNLIKFGGKISKANNGEFILFHKDKEYRNNDFIWFKSKTVKGKQYVSSISDTETENENKYGYLAMGNEIETKHCQHLFEIAGNPLELKSDIKEAINRHNTIIEDFYKEEKINILSADSKVYDRNIIKENNSDQPNYFCVWYEEINGKYYFSPACLGRDIYYNKFDMFVRDYKHCNDINCLCPACRLFGTVIEQNGDTNKASALGSRVRFSDAVYTGTNPPEYAEITTLKELAGPKSTCVEMYTRRKGEAKNAFTWNYDYYKKTKDSPVSEINGNLLELNGRKFYYHHPECKSEEYYKYSYINQRLDVKTVAETIKNNSERLVTVRPLKGELSLENGKTNTFTFDLFFEKIKENELKQLLIAASLFGNKTSYCHKLGMGKPIGLGSVKVKVNSVSLRKIDKNLNYVFEDTDTFEKYYSENSDMIKPDEINKVLLNSNNKTIEKGSPIDCLLKLIDFNYAESVLKELPVQNEIKVSYPISNAGEEGFNWFSCNKKVGGEIIQTLSVKDEGNIKAGTLLVNEKISKNKNEKKNKKDEKDIVMSFGNETKSGLFSNIKIKDNNHKKDKQKTTGDAKKWQ